MPDFSGIKEAEFIQLIEHMLAQDYLYLSNGLLSFGDRSERVFGRKNFMELYAVFTSPQLYRVITAQGQPQGSLEQNFVDKLVDGVSCFLLGGRPWLVDSVRHSDRTVVAHPAPFGRKPAWGGYLPQFLGHHLCREMAAILSDERPLPYLDKAAKAAIAELRSDLGPELAAHHWSLRQDEQATSLLTFAGGAVNQTVKYGLNLLKGWTLTADNFRLQLHDQTTVVELDQAMQELAQKSFWEDPAIQQRLLNSLPEYRLSKFQQVLPQAFAMEMVRDYMLDIETTQKFINCS